MSDLLSTHPEPERLAAFSQGVLSDPDCATIEEHVAGCDACQQVLETLPDAPLAGLVRVAVASAHAAAPRLGLQPGYEILEEIGRGGMGVVYKARQAGLNRFVALKKIHAGTHTRPETLARFRREAEAVARLDHPNIVQIHEVGEHEGQFYLALEYVEGGALADQLTGPLPPQVAAELVQTLARAVDHAHQRGIVHRDLKPANILLASGGCKPPGETGAPGGLHPPLAGTIPKISDFGLAKDLTRELKQTQTGVIVGTPGYMAPEQAGGQVRQIGPAADIYGLGAILYETLTGRPPFQGTTPLETLEQVRGQEPVPPSRLQPKVPRDLETVCLQCLRKEPARRYASAAALAEDLRRFLAGEAIQARPVPRWERAWRWARRRPALAALVAVSLAAAAALVIATAVYTSRLQAAVQREQAERQRAQQNLRRANEAVEHLLTRMGAVKLYEVPELQGVREEILADARDLYEAMLKDQADPDPETRYQHALTLCALARLQGFLGRYGEAEANYREGLKQLHQLANDSPDSPQYRATWAHHRVDLGQVYEYLSRFDKAEEAYREVIRLCQEMAGSYPPQRRELAYAYNRLGALVGPRSNEDYHLKALALREALWRENPDDPAAQSDLATTHHNLGLLYYYTGRPAQAEAALRRAVQLWQGMLRARPAARDARSSLAETLMVLSAVRQDHDLAEAIEFARQALASREELAQKFPSFYPDSLARSRHILASLYLKARRLAEAEVQEAAAVAYRERALVGCPQGVSEQLSLAECLISLGVIQGNNRHGDRAEATLRRAVQLAEEVTRQHPDNGQAARDLGVAAHDLAGAIRDAGRPAEALPYHDRSVQTLDALCRKASQNSVLRANLLNAYGDRAVTLRRLGRHAAEVLDWDRVVALAAAADLVRYRILRAQALVAAGDHVRAAAEAGALAATSGMANDDLNSLVQVYAQAIPAARKDPRLAKAEQDKRAEKYAAAALTLLHQLRQAGYFNTPEQRARLRKGDADLEPLHARPEFQKLVASLPAD